jgi:hypothetical protein
MRKAHGRAQRGAMWRRGAVPLAVVAILAGTPAGFSLAKGTSESEPGHVEAPQVPADECPAAQQAFESIGRHVDSFSPDCPTASEAADMVSQIQANMRMAEESGLERPLSDPTTASGPEAYGAVPEQEWRKSQGRPRPSEEDEVNFAAEGPAPWQAETCRREGPSGLGTTPLHCEAIIAVTEGRLAPGTYSDEQLREQLRQ